MRRVNRVFNLILYKYRLCKVIIILAQTKKTKNEISLICLKLVFY